MNATCNYLSECSEVQDECGVAVPVSLPCPCEETRREPYCVGLWNYKHNAKLVAPYRRGGVNGKPEIKSTIPNPYSRHSSVSSHHHVPGQKACSYAW
jgi:hypothetical protein